MNKLIAPGATVLIILYIFLMNIDYENSIATHCNDFDLEPKSIIVADSCIDPIVPISEWRVIPGWCINTCYEWRIIKYLGSITCVQTKSINASKI